MGKNKKEMDTQIGVDNGSDILSEAHWHDTDEVKGEIIDEFYFGEKPKEESKKVDKSKEDETLTRVDYKDINSENLYKQVDLNIFDIGNEAEVYNVSKNIKLRKSTANMVSDLRMMHPNANVRISRIIDDSIRHYYKFIKDQGGFVVEKVELNASRSVGLAKATRDIIYDENYAIPFDEKININGGIEELSGDLIKEYFRASESELYWEVSKFSLEALGKKLGIVQNSKDGLKVKTVG